MVKNVSRKWYRDLLSKDRNANGPSWAAHSLELRAACVSLWGGGRGVGCRAGTPQVHVERGVELQSELVTSQSISLFKHRYDIVILLMESRQVSAD